MDIWAVFISVIFQTLLRWTFLDRFPCARISLEYNPGSSVSTSPGIVQVEQISPNCSPTCLQILALYPEAWMYLFLYVLIKMSCLQICQTER